MTENRKWMVICEKCGARAIPGLMFSMINSEGNPCWLCDDCYGPTRSFEEICDAVDGMCEGGENV